MQGVQKENNYMSLAAFASQSTSDLLFSYFQESLPNMQRVENISTEMLAGSAVAEIFSAPSRVMIIRLGADAAPVAQAAEDLWINIDSAEGRSIVAGICARNEGVLGLWIAVLEHAPAYTQHVAPVVRRSLDRSQKLGLVRRQYLMGLLR